METPVSKYDIPQRELARGRRLAAGAIAAPIVMAGIPAVLFFILLMLFGTTPPVAATFFFIGLILTILGFAAGLVTSGVLAYRRSKWTAEMRERIAADGIRADEVDWFRNELRSNEKRALRSISAADPVMADAYRETLASRLTASRILRSSRKELTAARLRESRLKRLGGPTADGLLGEIGRDAEKLESIHAEAREMLSAAEARLQMIESAAARGSSIADSELALKKLSARAESLPLALEEAKLTEEIRRELENETAEQR